MDIAAEICTALADEWLPEIYRVKIRRQRTRSVFIDIPKRENQSEIQYTLLGIELKIGRRRIACPDLATARYMRVFARLGCGEFAIPYDITKISAAADQLETSWQTSLRVLTEKTLGKSARSISGKRKQLLKAMRFEITSTGAGDAMPVFDRVTKQRLQD